MSGIIDFILGRPKRPSKDEIDQVRGNVRNEHAKRQAVMRLSELSAKRANEASSRAEQIAAEAVEEMRKRQ